MKVSGTWVLFFFLQKQLDFCLDLIFDNDLKLFSLGLFLKHLFKFNQIFKLCLGKIYVRDKQLVLITVTSLYFTLLTKGNNIFKISTIMFILTILIQNTLLRAQPPPFY